MSQPPGLDLVALQAFLDEASPGLLTGGLHAELIAGGKSNLTYVVSDGSRDVVVRRPPLGHVLATAHDMSREHRVMAALSGTPVPVPHMYAECTDTSVIGAPFYVMERVGGTPYRTSDELKPLGPNRTRAIADDVTDTLVALHSVDPASVGLSDFGRPDGYLERQVRRWKAQMDGSASRELHGEQELHERLAASIPASAEATIVHGDYRMDNTLVDDSDHVCAVLDWEMATLGDPLADVALMLVYQSLASIAPHAVSTVSQAPGHPTRDDIAQRYSERSGRDLSHLAFHEALAYYKLAAILEGIYFRFTQGQTVGAGFEDIGAATEPLLAAGLDVIQNYTPN
ncbi:phosphotransferase family protein [Rudaeicoccus suwonensis]|uniref:Aminoglycoside phosphotransferase (APT) family kinase protein n=1 Tax=Rudaeicoccus suwonensis TaxID=657409 RepID=A0A561E7R5_9MICO|nr:phosphotransferase family protein [Rudaeicoccus suwonensis]TWE11658.1 aminoglycoside phosphotransferase (APT) family kinase protein [Rudaeicoccus suwonensis]